MWFDIFEKTSTLDLALMERPEITTLYEEARAATNNNRCTNVLDAFFNNITIIITIASLVYILVAVQFAVVIVIAVVVILQAFSTIESKRRQYAVWKEDAKTNKEISYCMGLLFDKRCANEMRLHNMSSWLIGKYKAVRERSDALWTSTRKGKAIFNAINELLVIVQQGVLYLFLAHQMIFRGLSFANFTLFFSSINLLSSNSSNFLSSIISINDDARYIKSFKAYMQLDNVIAVHKENETPLVADMFLTGELNFKDVAFSYPGSGKILFDQLSIDIKMQEFYVIVGPNGAGKTTFINLLMRLYDPTGGNISLNGTDIRDFNFQKYRDNFGVVFQDYMVFEYSIYENITMDSQETPEAIEKVTDVVNRSGLVGKVSSLDKGIFTRLGKKFDTEGVNLSGGEYQKVALAKALYRNSPMLVLDEPSSALDAFAEEELIKLFKESSNSKTVFYISHRLSVAKYAYKVIFINDGKIHGFDSHSNLLRDNLMYKEMFEAQAQHYTSGDSYERSQNKAR